MPRFSTLIGENTNFQQSIKKIESLTSHIKKKDLHGCATKKLRKDLKKKKIAKKIVKRLSTGTRISGDLTTRRLSIASARVNSWLAPKKRATRKKKKIKGQPRLYTTADTFGRQGRATCLSLPPQNAESSGVRQERKKKKTRLLHWPEKKIWHALCGSR